MYFPESAEDEMCAKYCMRIRGNFEDVKNIFSKILICNEMTGKIEISEITTTPQRCSFGYERSSKIFFKGNDSLKW